jgi:transcriptional regulator with XRE-family HTH domain
MQNLKQELADLAQNIFEQSGLTKKEFCEKLGINSSNWARDIESGTWLSDIENLLKFHQNISSAAVKDFILNHFEIELPDPPVSVKNSSDTPGEIERLTKQNEIYKKKLRELALSANKIAMDRHQESTAILTMLLDS